MNRFIFIAIYLGLVSCAQQQIQWERSDYIGKTFSLDHPTKIQDISFSDDHFASVTYGQRKGDYIEICGPLMYWRQQGNRLDVYDDKSGVYESFVLVSRRSGSITVRNRDGQVVTFKVK